MKEYLTLLIAQIPRYFMDLMEVTARPKRFLVARCTPDDEALNKAFIFFGVTLAISFLILIPSLPKKEDYLLDLAINAAIIGLVQLATVIVLRIAWRIVGGKAELRELFSCTAYATAPALFILLIFVLIGDILFRLVDPEGSAFLRANPLTFELPASSYEKGGALLSTLFALLGLCASGLWFFFAWGAYRILNGVSKPRSAIALVLFTILSLPLYVVSFLLNGYLWMAGR